MKPLKRYLFWVKKTMLGRDCLPLDGIDIPFAILFGSIFLPIVIVISIFKRLYND